MEQGDFRERADETLLLSVAWKYPGAEKLHGAFLPYLPQQDPGGIGYPVGRIFLKLTLYFILYLVYNRR